MGKRDWSDARAEVKMAVMVVVGLGLVTLTASNESGCGNGCGTLILQITLPVGGVLLGLPFIEFGRSMRREGDDTPAEVIGWCIWAGSVLLGMALGLV